MTTKQMTTKQIDAEIKRLESQRQAIYKRIAPLEALRADLKAKETVAKSKYKVGQKVEYRLDGCKSVHFGCIKAINARRWNCPTYLVERISEKGVPIGFGNEVQDREIFGASHK